MRQINAHSRAAPDHRWLFLGKRGRCENPDMKTPYWIAACVLALALAQTATAADPSGGAALFESRCAMCHSLDPSEAGTRGPHLSGLFQRRYGAVKGFPYRMVWTAADPVWTRAHLDGYLEIHRLPEAAERSAMIDYLEQATRRRVP